MNRPKERSSELQDWLGHSQTRANAVRQQKTVDLSLRKLLSQCELSSDVKVVRLVTELREARKMLALFKEGEIDHGRSGELG